MEQKQLRTERGEMLFCCHGVLSSAHLLVVTSSSGEYNSEELVSELPPLYEGSRKDLVLAGLSSPVAVGSPLGCELKSHDARIEIESVAEVGVEYVSKWKLNALQDRYAELDSVVTRVHNMLEAFKRLRAKKTRMGDDDEKTAPLLTHTANMF